MTIQDRQKKVDANQELVEQEDFYTRLVIGDKNYSHHWSLNTEKIVYEVEALWLNHT